MVKYTKELAWKDHSVDLEAFDAWARSACGEHYCGNSADVSLKLHFLEKPSENIEMMIDLKWEELDNPEHDMCASYKSSDDRVAEKQSKRNSAKAKLAALGLDAEEITALLG